MRFRAASIALGLLLILLAGADFLYWRFATTRLEAGFQQWQAEMQAQGWTIHQSGMEASGWPFSACITATDMSLRRASSAGAAEVGLAVPAVSLSLPLAHPTELRIRLSDPVHVRVGSMPEIILTARTLDGTAGLQRAGSLPVSIGADALRIETADGDWRASIAHLTMDATISTSATVAPTAPMTSFTLQARTIGLPATLRWPLGPEIASFVLQGSVSGPSQPMSSLVRAAEAWRDGGGSCEISKLGIVWGPLDVTGTATLALDEQLQPMGTGTAHVVGYAETLDRLAAGGVMTRSAATAAKAVLSLMAGIGDDNNPSGIDVPLTLQYRTLSMRQIPLVRLPPLDWPPAQ